MDNHYSDYKEFSVLTMLLPKTEVLLVASQDKIEIILLTATMAIFKCVIFAGPLIRILCLQAAVGFLLYFFFMKSGSKVLAPLHLIELNK